MKEPRGITLIVLIVTIVVLLILAGVTVAHITGGEGIIEQASERRDEATIANEKQQISLAITNAMNRNKWGYLEQENLQTELASIDTNIKLYYDDSTFKILFDKSKRVYTVDCNGNISYNDILDINTLDKIATGIYAKKLENNQVEIINTATNKISYTTIWNGEVADNFESGDGSESNPYIIKTAEQLAYLAKFVNDGNDTIGKYFELKSDIMLNWDVLDDDFNLNSGTFNIWIPIGYNDVEANSNSFKGIFNGNNHIVSGVYFPRTGNNYKGLFGHIGQFNYSNCYVKNIGVTNSYMRGYDIGGIIGYNYQGNILNCYYSGNLSGAHNYGGIYAYTRGTTNLSNFFVEGTCDKISDYGSPQNAYIASSSYTLPDFIKQYMK